MPRRGWIIDREVARANASGAKDDVIAACAALAAAKQELGIPETAVSALGGVSRLAARKVLRNERASGGNTATVAGVARALGLRLAVVPLDGRGRGEAPAEAPRPVRAVGGPPEFSMVREMRLPPGTPSPKFAHGAQVLLSANSRLIPAVAANPRWDREARPAACWRYDLLDGDGRLFLAAVRERELRSRSM